MNIKTLNLAQVQLILVQNLVREGSFIEAFTVLEEAIALIEEYRNELFTEIERSL